MNDMVQVVRVEDCSRCGGDGWYGKPRRSCGLCHQTGWEWQGGIVELTQERREGAGVVTDDGTLTGEDYVETRLVSEWEANR